MKKLIGIWLLLMSACFAELRVENQTKKFDIGFFVGGGIGVGANAMKYYRILDATNKGFLKENQSFASFVASAKLGVYHYFTPMIGLRAYYNLDLNVLPLDTYYAETGSYDPYVFSASHTVNADVIVNVFSYNNLDVAVIGGLGLGALVGEAPAKQGSVFYKNADVGSSFLDFEFRFNLGARVMFDKKYGIEFMAKLPVTPATAIAQLSNHNKVEHQVKYSPYYFTLDFVIEKF